MEESQGKAQEKEVLNFADPEIRCISTPQLGGGVYCYPNLGRPGDRTPALGTWNWIHL